MIEKIDKDDRIHGLSTYAIIDKINEIIDFLNDTYIMKVKDGQYISVADQDDYVCVPGVCTDTSTFITGLSLSDDLIDSCVESVTTVTSDIKCPHCGESYYTIEESLSTCVYYPPIIKDGVNINPDRNTTTQYCRCLNCNERFTI